MLCNARKSVIIILVMSDQYAHDCCCVTQKMPEEEAFAVLVKIMYNYGHRDVFKANFQNLHLMFYQLDRLMEVMCESVVELSLPIHNHSISLSLSLSLSLFLSLPLSHTHINMQEYLPDLFQHFQANRIETHMYASQWFLTIYTAKFPLSIVFRILDIYLCEVCIKLVVTCIHSNIMIEDRIGEMLHVMCTCMPVYYYTCMFVLLSVGSSSSFPNCTGSFEGEQPINTHIKVQKVNNVQVHIHVHI